MTSSGVQVLRPSKGPRKIPPIVRLVLPLACILLLVFVSGCLSTGLLERGKEETAHLTISGSTTVQPVSELLAEAFMKDHPGVLVTVNGGGSTKGIVDAGEGNVSLGSASRMPDAEEIALYPDLQVHRIGGSAVVVIAHKEIAFDTIQKEDLATLFDGTGEDITQYPGMNEIRATVKRSDASGTEEVFAQWLFGPDARNLDAALGVSDSGGPGSVLALAAEGNLGVLDLVKNTPGSIGFVDFGFAEGNTGVTMLGIGTGPGLVFPEEEDQFGPSIRDELALQNGRDDRYIEGLTRPLLYLTNGPPDPWEEEFIRFARSPEAAKYFREAGYFPGVDFSR